MAVTSIWKVEGRLARVLGYAGNPDKAEGSPDEWELQGVGAAILYAADPGKTERQLYVTGVNCLPATALEEMNATKRQYGKTGGIVAFHGYQAFAPGETDPATAHEVGVALAQELWGGRFEVVVATHLDKAHLHNHFGSTLCPSPTAGASTETPPATARCAKRPTNCAGSMVFRWWRAPGAAARATTPNGAPSARGAPRGARS